MTTKQLNRQQARWAKFLLEFNFRITYRLGKEGEKPDTLTRLAQNRPKGFDNSCQQHQFQTLLKVDQLDDNVRKTLAVMFYADEADQADEVDGVDALEVNEVDEVENKDIVDVRDYMGLDLHQHSNVQQNLELSFFSTKMAGSRIENSLEDLLNIAYQDNEIANSIIAAKRAGFQKLPADFTKQGIKLAMGDLTLENSGRGESVRLYVKGSMYVPSNEKLKLFLLQQHHDSPTQGHLGYKAMLRKMLEN